MSKQYIIGIDQSTSGTKLILVNEQGEIVYKDSLKHQQYYPQDNWIEHDPVEIYDNVKALINKLMNKTIVPSSSLKALSITNQRETVLAWDKHTGEPIYNAIVWQCTRTQEVCNHLKMNGYEALIKSKTGLTIDPYFSATKIQWLLENVESAKEKIANLDLLVGTIDSWIVWKLTGGKTHATDVTNASRTLLYNIYSLKWDRELLDLFRIPEEMLPEVKNCDEIYGRVSDVNILLKDIPISGVIGDSQAALFGQRCFEEGATKATFGTGTSVLVHTDKLMETEKGLVTCVAWGRDGIVSYAIEGIIRTTGDVLSWLHHDLELFQSFDEAERLANSIPSNEGVYIVPALVGLGAPYWSPNTKAAILGMNRSTTKAHIIRAGIECIAYQLKDVLDLIELDTDLKIPSLKVDGGATSNQFLMQYSSNILNKKVTASNVAELSVLGSIYLAGLATNVWNSISEIEKLKRDTTEFNNQMHDTERYKFYSEWKTAVQTVLK